MRSQRLTPSIIDLWIVIPLICLLLIGTLMIYSIASNAAGNTGLFWKQLFLLGLGTGTFLASVIFNYRQVSRLSGYIYGVLIFILIFVLIFGKGTGGTHRWISLGFFALQPSEIAKLLFIMTLSVHFSRSDLKQISHLFPLVIHTLIPFFLIFKEPDLGTALVLIGIFLGMLVASPIAFIILLGLASPVLSIITYSIHESLWAIYLIILGFYVLGWYAYRKWHHLPFYIGLINRVFIFLGNWIVIWIMQWGWERLALYQKKRILTFLSPGQDPLNSGYQVHQSMIAVGSGGWRGQGYLSGSQTQFRLIPEQHTDFIFSAVGEELGLIGCFLVLSLFFTLILRIYYIASRCQYTTDYYLCIGVATLFLFHVCINTGMNIGIMPVTGLPLPLLSYGGTALMVQLACLGMVMKLRVQQFQHHPISRRT